QGRLWSVGTEEGDAPAVAAQRDPEADQAEVVELAARACQQGARAAPTIPTAGESQQPAADHAGRKMLLGDRRAPVRPALAEIDETRDDHRGEYGGGAPVREQPIEHGVRADVIELPQRLGET